MTWNNKETYNERRSGTIISLFYLKSKHVVPEVVPEDHPTPVVRIEQELLDTIAKEFK